MILNTLAILNRIIMTPMFRMQFVQKRWARRYKAREFDDSPWTPLKKHLAQCRVALVTTGGVHLKTDRPFNMSDINGDSTFRVIPAGSSQTDLMITHDYYDHRDADKDINVVFPIDVLRHLQAEYKVGPSAHHFYSLMGHIEGDHQDRLIKHTAPDIANRLLSDGVDIAIFTPA